MGLLFLAGCGFQPVYGTRTNSVFNTEMRHVEISPIKDRIGQLLRNELEQQITPKGRARIAKYILKEVVENRQAFAVALIICGVIVFNI